MTPPTHRIPRLNGVVYRPLERADDRRRTGLAAVCHQMLIRKTQIDWDPKQKASERAQLRKQRPHPRDRDIATYILNAQAVLVRNAHSDGTEGRERGL